uniref:Vps54_N domain-containing protein n=1 Tax=Syphacia muris TaxID=451379 RepID=A0A158R3U5_9BILA
MEVNNAASVENNVTSASKKNLKSSITTKETCLLDAVDSVYYIEDDFDSVKYELKKMVEINLMPEAVASEVEKLKSQLQVVSKCISAKIIENSPSYSAQLKDVDEIQDEIKGIVCTVSSIRGYLFHNEVASFFSKLSIARNECTRSLEIIANHRNRKYLRKLKASLKIVKTLYEIGFQLKDLIQEGNFPQAITLCREAQKAASSCCQFYCIREISEKFKNIMDNFITELNVSLVSLTVIFDPDKYTLVYKAFEMLDEVKEAGNHIVKCFNETLESSSRRVIVERLLSPSKYSDIEKMSYERLCEAVDMNQILNCVRELGFVLCKILFNYHAFLRYHVDLEERLNSTDAGNGAPNPVRLKLTDSLYNVFKTASQKFNTLLCCHDLSVLKFDHFLDIVEMSNRFKQFGRTYFGNACGEVTISLEKQAYFYFSRYHYERMEEMKMFLENEAFALCPVPLQFTLFDLQEFYFLKESMEGFEDASTISDVEADLGEQLDYKIISPELDNPFSSDVRSKRVEILTPGRKLEYAYPSLPSKVDSDVKSSSADVLKTLSQNDADEVKENCQQFPPILCNTALNLLRYFGRYLRMTYLLRSIAEQAIFAIFQLYSYFLYTVHSFFSDEESGDSQFCSSKLLATLKYAKDNVLCNETGVFGNNAFHIYMTIKNKGSLSSVVHLHDADHMYAFSERIVGAESIVFLTKQLNVLHPILESLVTSVNGNSTAELLIQMCNVLPPTVDIRRSIYGSAVNKVLQYNQLISMVSSTKWDISELHSQHSEYVDFLIEEMKKFALSLEKIYESIPLSADIILVLWDCIIWRAFRAIVQGYCESNRKCSNEGRALMQLDLQQLIMKIEQLTHLQSIPHKDYVENYVKAYYLSENSLEQWILQHSEYSVHQMVSLLNVASHVSKKARTRIISLLTE